jgi:hypothetical protein
MLSDVVKLYEEVGHQDLVMYVDTGSINTLIMLDSLENLYMMK